MGDGELHSLSLTIGGMEAKIDTLIERGDEDRRDAGRHRQLQREQMGELSHEVRSIGDRVTRIESTVEPLARSHERKKVARDWLGRLWKPFWSVIAVMMSVMAWSFDLLGRFGKFVAALKPLW